MALLAMVVSCTNNASGTNNSNVAVFENTSNPDVTERIKGYKNNTWEWEEELTATAKKVVIYKGTHGINFTKDGTYTIIMTHAQENIETTFAINDESTWGNLVDISGSVQSSEISLEENGTELIMNKGKTSQLVFNRK